MQGNSTPPRVLLFFLSQIQSDYQGLERRVYCGQVVVVVVVFTLKTVLTSIQYLLFLVLHGNETNFRGHKLTQNKVHKIKKKGRPRESSNTCVKVCNRFLKITTPEKQEAGWGRKTC